MSTKEFGILRAYIVPHPPVVLPEIGRGSEAEIEATGQAMRQVAKEMAELAPDTIILSSPHAPAYRDAFFISASKRDEGDLGSFGFPQLSESLENDLPLIKKIMEKAERGEIEVYADTRTNRLDHGSLVPLYLLAKNTRISSSCAWAYPVSLPKRTTVGGSSSPPLRKNSDVAWSSSDQVIFRMCSRRMALTVLKRQALNSIN